MNEEIAPGIVIGLIGGLAAGAALWLIERLNQYEIDWRDERVIFKWLQRETAADGAKKWRSTRAIASYTNLTEDRVRNLCSTSKRIVQSTGEKDVWAVVGTVRIDISGPPDSGG